MDFSLDLEIEVICSLNFFLSLYLLSVFNFYSFMFIINMNVLVLMYEMVGYTFYRIGYHI